MFKFRSLAFEDFPLLHEWLSREHVKRWWDDGDDTLEKVTSHYSRDDQTARFILIDITAYSEKPIGYFQYYFAQDGVIGIDQFIGEADYLNRGIGEKSIRMFVQMIKTEHQPRRIILDPSPDNKRAIRCYEKVGFKHYETILTEDGDAAYMMSLDYGNL